MLLLLVYGFQAAYEGADPSMGSEKGMCNGCFSFPTKEFTETLNFKIQSQSAHL